MLKALFVFNMIGGEFVRFQNQINNQHPECSMIYSSLAHMYKEANKQQSAINCLFEYLERNSMVYGAMSIKVAYSYQCLSLAHYEINDQRQAIEFEEKSLEIFKALLKPDDSRIKDSERFLEKMKKCLQERTSQSPSSQCCYKIGTKSFQNSNPVEDSDLSKNENEIDDLEAWIKSKVCKLDFFKIQERERLLHKLRIAKQNAKYGFRRYMNPEQMRIFQNHSNPFNKCSEDSKCSQNQEIY